MAAVAEIKAVAVPAKNDAVLPTTVASFTMSFTDLVCLSLGSMKHPHCDTHCQEQRSQGTTNY
jgi:hypothetical protein